MHMSASLLLMLMLQCPVKLHLQNTNEKIELRISGWYSRALNEVQVPSELMALGDCTGHMPIKPAQVLFVFTKYKKCLRIDCSV